MLLLFVTVRRLVFTLYALCHRTKNYYATEKFCNSASHDKALSVLKDGTVWYVPIPEQEWQFTFLNWFSNCILIKQTFYWLLIQSWAIKQYLMTAIN